MNQHLVRGAYSLLALAVVAGLTGCMVGPTYQRPAVEAGGQFKGGQALSQRSAVQASVALERWWEGFNDPLLNHLVDTALHQNLSLEQAMARSAQSAVVAQSARAQLFPSGQATADAMRARQSLEDPLVATQNAVLPGFDRTGSLYGAGISSSWEIDLSGGLRRSAHAALAEYQAAQADVAAARIQVAASVVDNYLLVRLLQSRLKLAEEQVSTQTDIERLVEVLKSRGLAPDQELQQTKSERAVIQASVPALQARLTAARNSLDVLLGRQPGAAAPELDSVQPIPSAPSIEAAGGTAALLRRRPDLIVAERRLAASNERIGQALAEYYPKVSLSALLGTVTPHSGNLFDGDANQAVAALGLRWRLFDFGRVDAQVKAAKGAYSERLANYRHSVLQATAEVEDSIAFLLGGESRAKRLLEGENARVSARDAVLASYKKGNSSHIELLETQSRLQRIQAERLDATYASSSSAVALYKALGGGWNEQPVPGDGA
ncbi:efflux transporter outer membrane subunit [Pseudomonas sp. X10]